MSAHDQARNVGPRVGAVAFWSYIASLTLAGIALLVVELPLIHLHDLHSMRGTIIVVAVLVFIGEIRPLVLAGTRDANGVSTSTAFVFALLLHVGLPMALLMQAGATVIADVMLRRAPWRTSFNVAQYSLSYGAAELVLRGLGRDATGSHPLSVSGHDLPVVAAAAVIYFLANNILVGVAVALRNHTSVWFELRDDFVFQLTSTGALLGLAPIIVVVMQRGPALVPLLLFPLAAVYATASMTRERERQSRHDPLTGLANRSMLDQLTKDAVQEATTSRTHLALFLLDLDRFKEINDTLGHQAGDALLKAVGRRLTRLVGPDDVIARLGGDEFAVLMPGLEDPRVASDAAERIRVALTEPFHHDGISHEVQGSIGIAMHPQHGSDFETLLQRADIAMYVAKENGTGVQVYSTEIDRHSTTKLSMVGELRSALDDGDLELHYQPKADLRSGDIIGVEALLRWQHPERGLIAPDEFIPLAEQTGLMRGITHFVIDEALRQVALWWQQGMRITVAVNVSARDLYDRNFAQALQHSLERYDVPPRALMVEVTESVLMADPARAASTLLSLAGLGVGVSLDDFGTGYSSLVHLKRLPVSEVKIDRSFVMRMDVHEDDAAIVRSIIDLAAALGLRTVAEGVETPESWDRLAVYGCDSAQGWYLSKAMAGEVATAWLHDYRRASVERERAAATGADERSELTRDRSMLA